MDLKTTLLLLFIAPALPVLANDCNLAYQQASYGLEHAEKAMASNNLEHLKLYAGRSSEALNKSYSYAGECGCKKAAESAYDAIEDLTRALSYDSFEKARYYTKESLKLTREILVSLDICGQEDTVVAMQSNEADLALQEQLLLEQQQRLKEKQRQLQEQLRQQEELQQRLRREKEARLEAQIALKEKAEHRLAELRDIANGLLSTLDCGNGQSIDLGNYTRTQSQLEQESLLSTRQFYADKIRELTSVLQVKLANCTNR
jgi:hypothetical protein